MDNSVGASHQSDKPSAAAPRMAGPERVPSKLRETCHACALSKVRCSKEKPSCSRCSKRGVTCEYIVTKRPGRKRDPKKSADREHLHHHHHHHHHRCNSLDPAPELDGANENCMWMEDMLPSVAGVEGAGGRSGSMYLASAPPDDPNSPMLWPGAAAGGAEMTGDMSDFLMPLITPMSTAFTVKTPDFLNAAADMMSVSGTPGHDQLVQDASASHVARLLLPGGAREEVASEVLSLDFLSTSMSASPSTAPQSSSLSSRALDDADSAPNSCCCLVKALDMMAKLSSTELAIAPSASTTRDNHPAPQAAVGDLHHDGDSLLSATLTANRQTIEALGTMLHGSCQDNVYLLTCMSMIVSKVLRRYEVAAAGQPAPAGVDSGAEELYGAAAPGGDDGREARDATSSGGDPLRRLSAQLVLGELHMVQQLVNRLSSRLRSSLDRTKDDVLGSENGDMMLEDQAFSPSSSSMVSFDDKPGTPFFSAATLSQMDHDLRKGLAVLSSNIINMLRRI